MAKNGHETSTLKITTIARAARILRRTGRPINNTSKSHDFDFSENTETNKATMGHLQKPLLKSNGKLTKIPCFADLINVPRDNIRNYFNKDALHSTSKNYKKAFITIVKNNFFELFLLVLETL